MSHSKNNVRKQTSKPKTFGAALKKLPLKKARPAKKTNSRIEIDVRPEQKDVDSLVALVKRKFSKAIVSAMPKGVRPMLATLVDEPFSDEEWLFELKLDGYRALAYLEKGRADIRSRNNHSFTKKFAPVHQALAHWKINAVVDGEIVVLNEEGVPDFSGIQQWEKTRQGQLVYYVFDLLWLDGLDITQEPLYLRREALKQIIPEHSLIRFSDHIDAVGKDFFALARRNHLEGIVAKKKDAPYLPNIRSQTWLKIKAEQRQEAIICGYTKKRDTDQLFSSLLLGSYDEGALTYLGQTGTGFSASSQQEVLKKMKPHITRHCPFAAEPDLTETPVWLKPFLVCEVKYTELTKEGVMRHASFQGMREDKVAFELNEEQPQKVEQIVGEIEGKEEGEDKTFLLDNKETEKIVTIEGHLLHLTNLKKYYWPKEKITKGSLLNYYYAAADHIMPYMKDRPQSLNRFPNGITGPHFYHKNMGGKIDKWLKTFERYSESTGEPKEFLICTDTASLLYMANLGCIEMNPWHSRVQTPQAPDWSVIDLDPGNIPFEKVIETAQVVKQVLDSLQIPSYPKTSGSTGLHIYIPLNAKYNYEQSRQLAELIAHLVHAEFPAHTSLVRNPQKRKDKIYIDYLQNRPIQTICAPYSVRPRPGAPVSAPLHWDEVKKGLQITQFTLHNILERLKTEGDLFAGVLGPGIDLNKVLKGLASLI